MPAEVKKEIQLEIAHVLFIDIVGYSKLSVNEQHAAVEELNQIVRATEQFQKAEAGSRLLKIPTGDGMALVFYTSPEAPAHAPWRCSRALKEMSGKPSSSELGDSMFTREWGGRCKRTGQSHRPRVSPRCFRFSTFRIVAIRAHRSLQASWRIS